MYQNLNMFTSPPVNVEFRIPEKYISLVIDFFGEHVSFHNTRQKGVVSCRLKVSKEAMKHWAVEHANIVRVVSPASLVDAVREEVSKAAEMYDLV